MANPKNSGVPVAGSEPDDNLFAEFLDDYFAECDDHLTSVRRNLLALESFVNRPSINRDLLDDLFRSFHSIKGISAMVGVRQAEQLAHHMESYLRCLRDGDAFHSDTGMDGLIAGTNMLEQVVAARRDQKPTPDVAQVIMQLEAMAATRPDPERTAPPYQSGPRNATGAGCGTSWMFVFTPSPELSERGVNVGVVRESLQQVGTLINAAPRVLAQGGIAFEFVVVSEKSESEFDALKVLGLSYSLYQGAAPALIQPSAAGPERESVYQAGGSVAPSSIVRVSLSRLDDLMRMVGELVVTRSHLDDQLNSAEKALPANQWRVLQETNQTLERQLRDLREGVMRVRMVPIGEIFERMQFVARDLARERQKSVRIEMSGQDTEIDKLLVERMMDPLLHLVRNSVSHGFESEDERRSLGKPAEGTISLRAFTAGEVVIIEVEDDGRGINRDLVARRAITLGLAAERETIDDVRLLEIICSPGFSTRDEADRASGRGVGMAVVKKTVEALGGMLALDTEENRGTRFIIELPVTLAIADALIVSVGASRFAVPLAAVREVIEVEPQAVKSLERNEVMSYRGGVLPLVRLARVFGLTEQARNLFHAFIVGTGPGAVGVVVDRILGQREIVVRTINDPLVEVAGIAGATELGDGRVVLILDAAAIAGKNR
jgi:two-component system, chemotaxis family, sensor kinase CheA